MVLRPPITKEEIGQAAQDLPGQKAVGPEEFPAEFYKYVPVLHETVACLFSGTLEQNQIPVTLGRLYVVPPDKVRK